MYAVFCILTIFNLIAEGGIGGLVLSIAHKRAEKRRPRRTLTTRNGTFHISIFVQRDLGYFTEDASESLLRDEELSPLSSADIPEKPKQPSYVETTSAFRLS